MVFRRPDSLWVISVKLTATGVGKNLREDVGEMIEKHPLMNAYWEDKNPKLSNITIPMYILASYSTGLHTEGTIRGYQYTSSKDKW